MLNDKIENKDLDNHLTLNEEITWFNEVLDFQLADYKKQSPDFRSFNAIPVPDLEFDSPYANLVLKEKLTPKERLVVLLALLPKIKPQVLDVFLMRNPITNRCFAEFGGYTDAYHGGFIPTIETAIFLLGGRNWEGRLKAAELFNPSVNSPILKMLDIDYDGNKGLLFRSTLNVKNAYYSRLIKGRPYFPRFSSQFPAKRHTTEMEWENLVLNKKTLLEVQHILKWFKYKEIIANNKTLKRQGSRGYSALFYGPSGTGKTLTATLLGKAMNKDVYCMDLSQIMSKYIGETEKNLANIFDQAEDKNWILFFDEADVIFRKRVNVSNANDLHSNQQAAYLLQRIENYPGIVILSSNLISNIDNAFARRLQSIIHFAAPIEKTRLKLWEASLPREFPLSEEIDLEKIAKDHKVTGGMIVNIVQYAVIATLADGLVQIPLKHLVAGILREKTKIGKMKR